MNHTSDISIAGKLYKVISNDLYIEGMQGIFNGDELDLFDSLIDKDSVVFDIGANIGLTSIFFAERCSKVYSFEPVKPTFEFLKQNISMYKLANVQFENLGFGRKKKLSIIAMPKNDSASGFISEAIVPHSEYLSEKVELSTLDSFTSLQKIEKVDFLKLDVEGYELEILLGGKKLLKRQRPVVVMELNHFCLNALQRITVPDFFDSLREIFPLLFAVDQHKYLDLHSTNDSYHVTYEHIVHGKFKSIVGCFDEASLDRFWEHFIYGV